MSKSIVVAGQRIVLSDPTPLPAISKFVGRKRELELCRTAWGVSPDGAHLVNGVVPLHFRLEGAPGCGKNEIVYEIARKLGRPLYIIQGHEEVTPEDLGLLLVPEAGGVEGSSGRLTLRASPLATALITGGLFFFDEINRVPERALSPLASVLDNRCSIYSAMAGIHIGPESQDKRSEFRFCCALNPQLSEAGRGLLPDYIEERTLPAIAIDYLPIEDLNEILRENLVLDGPAMDEWEAWYKKDAKRRLSVRQAITILRYASRLEAVRGDRSMGETLADVEPMVLRSDERGSASSERPGDEVKNPYVSDVDEDAVDDKEEDPELES